MCFCTRSCFLKVAMFASALKFLANIHLALQWLDIYLFQVIRGQHHAGKLFPDRRCEVEIQRFLGPHRNAKQNAEKSKHSEMFFAGQHRVQQEAIAVVSDVVGWIRCRNQQRHNPGLQFLHKIYSKYTPPTCHQSGIALSTSSDRQIPIAIGIQTAIWTHLAIWQKV